MKVLIINNLKAGNGSNEVFELARLCSHPENEVTIRSTDCSFPFEDMLGDAQSFDVVVAAGGDGTLASVLYALRDTQVPVLPLACGTANLLTLNIAHPLEAHGVFELLTSGHILDFDLGELVAQGQKRGFAIIGGAGYDAAIMSDAASTKAILGQLSYFVAAGVNLFPQHSEITLTIDDKVITTSGIGVLFVNFSKLQMDVSITHENKPRDGKFDVVILKTHKTIDLLPAVFAAMLDRDGNNPNRGEHLEIYQGSHIHMEADPPLPIQYDGEPTKLTTPIDVSILPQAARLIVSDEGYKTFKGDDK
ncbi:MAG: NAD(+)/NADH kinase [Eggerthellaceae bacterium]|nr:NAD(+)/NADH kinase [Eggerthellaceae bacterium]